MSDTRRKHVEPKKYSTKREKAEKTPKQKRANERAKLRKDFL